MPETRNSSGIPHSDPHTKNTVNPRLGCGAFTNQETPEANTMAEWNTTSPATTNARITSNSGRRPAVIPARSSIPDIGFTSLGDDWPQDARARPGTASGHGLDSGFQPKPQKTLPPQARIHRRDEPPHQSHGRPGPARPVRSGRCGPAGPPKRSPWGVRDYAVPPAAVDLGRASSPVSHCA